MRHLDLFSGIGGFSLGLERAGFETVAFCEIDEYARKVLAKHWPGVPIYGDVRNVTAETITDTKGDGCGQRRARGIVVNGQNGSSEETTISAGPIDIITGGFPCQDISHAGKQAGIEGERSGLWGELARIIGEVRPRYAIVENVPALLSGDRGRWFGRVLGDLAEIGYDCEWHCIPASHIGASHRRDRVWIIAYSSSERLYRKENKQIMERERINKFLSVKSRNTNDVADTENDGIRRREQFTQGGKGQGNVANPDGQRGDRSSVEQGQDGREIATGNSDVSDAEGYLRGTPRNERPETSDGRGANANTDSKPKIRIAKSWRECNQWTTEPNVGRVAHGVPSRVDRLRCLGNAIVPQIAEIIGRAILEVDNSKS